MIYCLPTGKRTVCLGTGAGRIFTFICVPWVYIISSKISIIKINQIKSIHQGSIHLNNSSHVLHAYCVLSALYALPLYSQHICERTLFRGRRESEWHPYSCSLHKAWQDPPSPTPKESMPSANCDSTLGAPLTTTGCRKYSSTAAPRRADRSTPWKEGWYLQKAPNPHRKVTSSRKAGG